MHFVTPRLLVMPYPSPDSTHICATYLNAVYKKQYLVFNLSERTYNTRPFHGQVIDHTFPGLPCPPVESLFSLCVSIKAWLSTDIGNIAVIHCQNGLARSLLVLSLFLVWSSPEFTDIHQSYARLKSLIDPQELVDFTPSQLRYFSYLDLILTNSPTSLPKICIRRVTFTGIPRAGLRPYLQIFENRRLIYTSSTDKNPNFVSFDDQSCQFCDINTPIQGDFLLRMRTVGEAKEGKTVFRCMLHTAFLSGEVIRLEKQELDGMNCEENAWIDVYISEIETGTWSFWESFGHLKPKVSKEIRQKREESEPGTEEDEEEKLDEATLEQYQRALEEDTQSSDLLL